MGVKRIFLIVLDSLGIGEMPDSARFGDEGSNTLKAISSSEHFSIQNLKKLGLADIDGQSYLGREERPMGAYAKMTEMSNGKDTTIGHWEIAGVISDTPLPTYPNGFPKPLLDAFSEKTGRGVLCNLPYSGTDVIRDYGQKHLESGDLIVYTSADSVFQIAAHKSIVGVEELYGYCRTARELLRGEHSVGRVIARPFDGEYPNFVRTAERHDFSLEPPKDTVLDLLKDRGLDVISIGKINDIFAGKGITDYTYTTSNSDGMAKTSEMQKRDFNGLCFVNLVDFDSAYGHRNDVDGYAAALAEFDFWLASFIADMRCDDVLMITADHGCDPSTESTDHSREYTPLLVYGDSVEAVDLGVRESFADIAATIAEMLGAAPKTQGESFFKTLTKKQ